MITKKLSLKSFIIAFILCIVLFMLTAFHSQDYKLTSSAAKADDVLQIKNENKKLKWTVPKSIPNILHQSWKTTDLPAKFKRWRDTWIANHPTWIHNLWTDNENRIFVSTHYPWFLSTFDKMREEMHRIDAVRYMYLHQFGGVYADLDFESIRPLDRYLEGKQLVLGRMGKDTGFQHSIPNAFMASIPGHPFWLKVLESITERYENPKMGVEDISGPVMLFHVYNSNSKDQSITISDGEIFYPYSWEHNRDSTNICSAQSIELNEVECKKKFVTENTLAITYWSHSWDGPENTIIQS